MDEFVASARAEGIIFVLDSERTLFTLEWRGPEDRLIEETIKGNYDAILAWLVHEAEEIEAKDIAVVRSILPGPADTAGVDWSEPLAAWTQDQMIAFLLLAWRLIGEAARTYDESKILKPAPFNEEIGDPIPLTGRPQFVLTLRPLPGVDGIRALRGMLKRLLRQYGMRCVDLRVREP